MIKYTLAFNKVKRSNYGLGCVDCKKLSSIEENFVLYLQKMNAFEDVSILLTKTITLKSVVIL